MENQCIVDCQKWFKPFWYQKVTAVNMQCDAEKTECPLNLLAKNMQSNGRTFKSWVFSQCTEHLVMTPEGERGLERLKDSKRTGHQTTLWRDLMLHNFGYFEN